MIFFSSSISFFGLPVNTGMPRSFNLLLNQSLTLK